MPLLRLAWGASNAAFPLVLRALPDQRHHRLVPWPQRRRFLDELDRRVVNYDRTSAAVECEAERRECARERGDVVVW